MAFTMACPNFKKGLKMAFGPLGVNLQKSLESSHVCVFVELVTVGVHYADVFNQGKKWKQQIS
jgi:hypothetical protein